MKTLTLAVFAVVVLCPSASFAGVLDRFRTAEEKALDESLEMVKRNADWANTFNNSDPALRAEYNETLKLMQDKATALRQAEQQRRRAKWEAERPERERKAAIEAQLQADEDEWRAERDRGRAIQQQRQAQQAQDTAEAQQQRKKLEYRNQAESLSNGMDKLRRQQSSMEPYERDSRIRKLQTEAAPISPATESSLRKLRSGAQTSNIDPDDVDRGLRKARDQFQNESWQRANP